MSASSSAIQRAISSAENTRVSGSTAPSARSREARKSINSCFSAGESETAAASMSASVTIRTSVYALRAVCKVHVPCPRAHAPNHFLQRAASWCNRLRSRSPAPPRHDRWGDAGAGVHLPRPFAEHRSGTRCELMRPSADWKVSRFLSRVPADDRVFQDNTAVVTNPTRGAFFAGCRTGAIERQKNISRCQGGAENRPVLVHWKNGWLVDRDDIIHDIELAPKAQPRCGD